MTTTAEKAPENPMTELAQVLVSALREASLPEPPPKVEVVTVGETSEPAIDRLVFCPDCLGRDGPRWGSHEVYWPAADPDRPGQVKRMSMRVAHPAVRKIMSYNLTAVKEGLEKGTHGKQCIQCGAPLLKL